MLEGSKRENKKARVVAGDNCEEGRVTAAAEVKAEEKMLWVCYVLWSRLPGRQELLGYGFCCF